MTEIEKLKKEIEDLKLIIESKNNQVESKNKHIKRLERIISNMKKEQSQQQQRGRSAPELTSSKFQNFLFPDYKLPLDFQAGAFSHPEWVATQITGEKKDHIGLRFRLAAVSANLIECRITQPIKCRIT